jgi:alkanesulfonate monooxygenase SsuD/methylene tetrahydromethanopterin reductase-like flavin-dependent oxidoreductase (luciferase family)
MQIGLALPSTVPDVTGSRLLDWAKHAEDSGFSSLGVLDRLAYDNLEPLICLASVSAVTERIRLATTVLTPAYRGGAAVLAKQVATLNRLSSGRVWLGVAAGGREDDYQASGSEFHTRGRRLDAILPELQHVWDGQTKVGPATDRPAIIVGGHSPAAIRRAATYGDGWIGGGGSPDDFAEAVRQVRAAWTEAGRVGAPQLKSNLYVSLGADGREVANRYLQRYYAFAPQKATLTADATITDPRQLDDTLTGYAEAGCDELILLPCSADTSQLTSITEALESATITRHP